jgi:hypothetical protein
MLTITLDQTALETAIAQYVANQGLTLPVSAEDVVINGRRDTGWNAVINVYTEEENLKRKANRKLKEPAMEVADPISEEQEEANEEAESHIGLFG